MDAATLLDYALGAAKLAELAADLWRRRYRSPEAGEDPVAESPGPDQEEEVHEMSGRSVKVTIEVFPGRTTQTMRVRASGRRGTLLLGKVRDVAYRQTLASAATEQLYVSQLLTQAQALVLSS